MPAIEGAMGVVEQSCAAVESYLSMLDQSYGSFSVNQTTVAVSQSRYEREREKAGDGSVDVYTKVRNDESEVLHVQNEETRELPSATVTDAEFERAAATAVETEAGVDCRITGVEQATILGVRNIDDDTHKTVYRLAVVFEASYTSGSVTGDAEWHDTTTQPEPVFA
jgi:hypothetical protein